VDHPAPEVIASIAEVVSSKLAASTGSPSSTTVDQDAPSPKQALLCYYNAFLTAVEPKTYKDDLIQSCWIEAMQEELNEFERLGVWELVARPDKVMVITLKWIYKVKLDELGAPRAWYDMLSSFLISQDFSKGSVDPTMFIRRDEKELLQARPTEKHLHAVKRIFWYLRGTINQGLWYPEDSSIALTAFVDADHAGCQDTRRSKSGSMQFLRDRLLADIFTKALGRERTEFLINKLGMRSFMPETLKQLADEVEE
nr:uncharacterized mitochondrial protein AtMg00810-like [Tanacetum cinerariifolium]